MSSRFRGLALLAATLTLTVLAQEKRDSAPTAAPALAGAWRTLFENNFDALPDGALPGEFLVLGGDFTVKHDGTNGFLELPGAPLDSFAVQFGPAEKENVAITAQILGTNKGRRTPTFGVGVGGISGWKLQVSPGKSALELLHDTDIKTSREFIWPAGAWTQLRLQVRKIKDGEWRIEGKAWVRGTPEPKDWAVAFDEKEAPLAGKASLFGSPFAGTPVQFDAVRVERMP
jgi:hypothetical protein